MGHSVGHLGVVDRAGLGSGHTDGDLSGSGVGGRNAGDGQSIESCGDGVRLGQCGEPVGTGDSVGGTGVDVGSVGVRVGKGKPGDGGKINSGVGVKAGSTP